MTKVFEFNGNLFPTMVCPFRTITTTTQDMETGTLVQKVDYPECQLADCPFYNKSFKDNSDRCFRTMVNGV